MTIFFLILLSLGETIVKVCHQHNANIDIDISYEEASFIKEGFVEKYKLRELSLIPQRNESDVSSIEIQGNIMFESVDTIVTNQLTNIQSEKYNQSLLLEIYRNL